MHPRRVSWAACGGRRDGGASQVQVTGEEVLQGSRLFGGAVARNAQRSRRRACPASVDTSVAMLADRVAALENRSSTQLVGEALDLWVRLPASARSAFRAVLSRDDPSVRMATGQAVGRALQVTMRRLVESGEVPDLAAHFPEFAGRTSPGVTGASFCQLTNTDNNR